MPLFIEVRGCEILQSHKVGSKESPKNIFSQIMFRKSLTSKGLEGASFLSENEAIGALVRK